MKNLQEVLKDWEAVIGLEIHTELTTLNTKMFCSCKVEHDAEPNTNVCPGCLGLPGTLPVPNKRAIESTVLAGLATDCRIEKVTQFYRKNYFYPDMTKNYQITQGPLAFCMDGKLNVEVFGKGADQRSDVEKNDDGSYSMTVGIERIHLEEDAGKLVHVGGESGRIAGASKTLIDYNRCGVPLIELVTKPDLRTPEEARRFMEELRTLFIAINISDCSMELGSMRCDGNVSIRRRGTDEFGTKTELKNMNSFKNLHDGLAYEICRQAEVLEEGGTIHQETRHFEPNLKRTIVMRTKETADDYRQSPDPNMAPCVLSDAFIEDVKERLPELPQTKRARFRDELGVSVSDAFLISSDVNLAEFFEEALEDNEKHAQTIANLLNNDVQGYLNAENVTLEESSLTPHAIAELAELLDSEKISSKQGKEVFAIMTEGKLTPREIVKERGMEQVSDEGVLEDLVQQIIEENPDQVDQYKNGNDKVIGYLVGQGMKLSQGKANPKLINQMLREALS